METSHHDFDFLSVRHDTPSKNLTRSSSNDDELAAMMKNVMESQRMWEMEMGHALMGRVNLISSVNWLGNHIPVCVLDRLGREIGLIDKHMSDLCDDHRSESGHDKCIIEAAEQAAIHEQHDDKKEGYKAVKCTVGERYDPNGCHKGLDEWADKKRGVNGRKSSLECSYRKKQIYSGDQIDADIPHEIPVDTKEMWNMEQTTPLVTDSTPQNPCCRQGEESLKLPYASRHECALLFVDISGFTKLSKLLDPESLSETINSYFQLIVDEVTSHGGDILKFAGDALFAEWQVLSDTNCRDFAPGTKPRSPSPRDKAALASCVAVAASCGASIVSKCSDFPVFAKKSRGASVGQGVQVSTLNVHCGLGAGEVVGVHVGDSDTRREYLILGDPISQATSAVRKASLGELLASPEALDAMSETCVLADDLLQGDWESAVLIARRKSIASFRPRMMKRQSSLSRCVVSHLMEDWKTESLLQYRKLISLYVHPVVVENDMAAFLQPRRPSSMEERHIEEAELRSVYVLFISMPKIRAQLTGNAKEDAKLLELLNDIMKVTTRELDRFCGHLRQFIVDDKGLVLIATFGLRGSSFPNMVTERALPATTVIHTALQSELGVLNKIGATLGNAYCGVVGGIRRHEYAVLGPSVNLAARLMTSNQNPGILVDDAIRKRAGKCFLFNALAPVKAKGYDEPVPIFEPLKSPERGWGRLRSNFVGRTKEIGQLMAMARETVTPDTPAKMAFVSAESGIGKTAMVIHAVEHIRKGIARERNQMLIAKHVCKENDLLLPFGMLRSLLPDVLGDAIQDDRAILAGDIEWDDVSMGSLVSSSTQTSGLSGYSKSADLLLHICREMDAPPEFLALVGHHLLGMDLMAHKDKYATEKPKEKTPSLQSTVNFMAQAFQMCTKHARLVIIALDDVQWLDKMSWKVLHKLFVTSRNLLIVGTARPYSLTVDESFWKELNEKYKSEGRFVRIDLPRLEKDEIRIMIARELEVNDYEISERFSNDVFIQSGGMPRFANEILESVKRRNAVVKGAGDLLDWRETAAGKDDLTFASIGELIIHRIDTFEATARNVLNMGAVLGHSFDLLEVVSVLQHFIGASQSQKELHTENICAALDQLVNEGVLVQVLEGCGHEETDLDDWYGDPINDKSNDSKSKQQRAEKIDPRGLENRLYTFCHDVWRASILKLMLDSRKRDIHRIIAMTLEAQQAKQSPDYDSRVKLFGHWKASGDRAKAASLSLALGRSFEELGLHSQSIRLYEDTLEMWKGTGPSGEHVGGLSTQVLDAVTVHDLEYIIKVYIAMGKCLANLHMAAECVTAYQNALQILQAAPAASEFQDRSIMFPIFSGLFVAIKFGQIEQDEECTYEQDLVRKFVNETRLNGDPVHYTRALAMQGEMYARLGNFKKALQAFYELKRTYNVDEHSVGICKAYGSDRSGQCFGASALWQAELGNIEEALRTCRYVIDELMPKMDPRNVHNSCIMLYSCLWVMKDNGMALEARDAFDKLVVQAFNEHYGEGAFTFMLPIWDSVLKVLNLAGKQDGEMERLDEYVKWALDEEHLRFDTVINNACGNLGRNSDSIPAEICLLLAKRLTGNNPDKITLVRHGLVVAKESVELTESKRMIIALKQVKPVLDELELLATELRIQ